VLFFDLSPVVPAMVDVAKKPAAVVAETARLRVRALGPGRLSVVQRLEGGAGIELDSVLAKAEGEEVELRVEHAVQAWLLRPSANLGLEVQGGGEQGSASLVISSREVEWRPRVRRAVQAVAECSGKCCPRPMVVPLR
jgi:hypothetical protein